MPILIVSVDPGTARTGYCWNIRGDDGGWATMSKGIVHLNRNNDYKELDDWLDTWPEWKPDTYDRFFVVCEQYIQRGVDKNGKRITDNWIKQGTAKIIGSVHREAKRFRAKFVYSQPANLRVGCGLAGIKSHSGHLPDDLSAQAHAAWFCVNGIPKRNGGWLD